MNNKFITYRKQKTRSRGNLFGIMLVCLLFITGLQNVCAQNYLNRSITSVVNNTATNISSSIKKNIATVGDYVWIDNNNNGVQDPGEPGVPNVMVVLYDSVLNTLDTKYTDAAGHYTFDSIPVPATGDKSFRVGFYNIPPNFAYANLVQQDSLHANFSSKLDPITGRTKLFRLHAGASRTDIDAGIKSAPGVVLPFTIDQLNGYYSEGVIQLKWSTFTEINMDHFNIERSTDGNNFRQIGKISAEGSNSENTNYSYLDISAERGSNFYRLAMIDNDGNYTYSKVITVSVDVKGITVSVVYPNPFSKRVQVKLDCQKPEQITIRVLDNAGIVVKYQIANLQKGENNIVIQNVAELPGGVYYLEVIGDHRSMKTKLMKQ